MWSAATAASSVPVKTAQGAASPQPVIPASVSSRRIAFLTAPSIFPEPCRRSISTGMRVTYTVSPVMRMAGKPALGLVIALFIGIPGLLNVERIDEAELGLCSVKRSVSYSRRALGGEASVIHPLRRLQILPDKRTP